MATRNTTVTSTVKNLVASGYTADTTYTLQNTGERRVYIFRGSAAPASRKGHWMHPGDDWTFEHSTEADDRIWVWTVPGQSSHLSVTEAE